MAKRALLQPLESEARGISYTESLSKKQNCLFNVSGTDYFKSLHPVPQGWLWKPYLFARICLQFQGPWISLRLKCSWSSWQIPFCQKLGNRERGKAFHWTWEKMKNSPPPKYSCQFLEKTSPHQQNFQWVGWTRQWFLWESCAQGWHREDDLMIYLTSCMFLAALKAPIKHSQPESLYTCLNESKPHRESIGYRSLRHPIFWLYYELFKMNTHQLREFHS